MGGSGGGFFGIGRGSNPADLIQKVRDAESQTTNQEYETEVGKLLDSLLAKCNDRDVETIKVQLDIIKNALDKEINGTVDIFFGGSVEKHTYVDGLSDIDALVFLDKSELKDMSPPEVRDYFYTRLKERLPKTIIEKGTLAVTVKFKDAEIQLLPAVKHKEGFQIANRTGRNWSLIKPEKFTSRLTKINQANGGKIVPAIKLTKVIIANFPENRRLSGYHIEALAIEVFQNYKGQNTTKSILTHFFRESAKLVLNPITDKTGQSTHVDDYLGSSNSLERKIVADSLGRVSRRMQNADGAYLVQQWRDILKGS